MTERKGKRVELINGKLIATLPDGSKEFISNYEKKEIKSYAHKVVPKDALDAVKPALRFVYDWDDKPEESFGIGQYGEYLSDEDKSSPNNLKGREEDPDAMIRWGCANFQSKGWSALNVTDLIFDKSKRIQTAINLDNIRSKDLQEMREQTEKVIRSYYPGNSPNRKLVKRG